MTDLEAVEKVIDECNVALALGAKNYEQRTRYEEEMQRPRKRRTVGWFPPPLDEPCFEVGSPLWMGFTDRLLRALGLKVRLS